MQLKKKKNFSSRHKYLIDKSLLSTHIRIKYLEKRLKTRSGRNDSGRITVRRRGGGHKKLFRVINFGSNRFRGVVLSTEYDPYRNSFVSLVFEQATKEFFYVLSVTDVCPGCIIECGEGVDFRLGNRVQLKSLPIGSIIANVSGDAFRPGVYARSAGTYCQLIQKGPLFSQLRIPSGKIISLSSLAYATIGEISNSVSRLEVLGQAGSNRHKGCRPKVRGVAMNPVDHPHGGGEGKTSGGRPSVTPWGRPTKGQPTRKKRNV